MTAGTVPPSTAVSLSSAGTYYWQASYSGDANNAASVSSCGSEAEVVVVPRPMPTRIVTMLHGGTLETGWWNDDIIVVPSDTAVTDSATLSGANVSSAGGTVTYTVYADKLCVPGFVRNGLSSCTPTVVGTETVTVVDGVVPNSIPATLPAGIYSWQASYSGDATNAASTSPYGSETEIVSKK